MADETKSPDATTLDEVLVAFQKTMARVGKRMRAALYSDTELLRASRSLYAIDGMNVTLHLRTEPAADAASRDKVRVVFADNPGDANLTVDFRVESRAVQELTEARLVLASYGARFDRPATHDLVAVALEPDGSPIADVAVHVHVTAVGKTVESAVFETRTDATGRLWIEIDAAARAMTFNHKPADSPLAVAAEWLIHAEMPSRALVSEHVRVPGGST
ncbi:MAG: hypothetical protein IT350_15845 [Deltaproteobacteria bacterium]|nr:hypothetical protein [Deltaproteobacteria bacterium]